MTARGRKLRVMLRLSWQVDRGASCVECGRIDGHHPECNEPIWPWAQGDGAKWLRVHFRLRQWRTARNAYRALVARDVPARVTFAIVYVGKA